MGEFEMLAALCAIAFLLIAVAVVGHGLWVLAAAVFRAISAVPPAAVPLVSPGGTQREELLAASRQLRRWLDEGRITQLQYDELAVHLQADFARFGQTPSRPFQAAPQVPAPAETVLEAQLVELEEPRRAPAFAPDLRVTPAASPPPAPPIAEPQKPSLSPADMLLSFMEESNIRWGEILAALFIVVSSVGLVVSLRATLQAIPYFPALLFMLFTVLFHGAGIYTLHRWKLHAVSRVVLIISLLLVPLAVSGAVLMSGSGQQQRPASDPLFLLALAIGAVVFAWVAWSASRELVSEGPSRLAAAVLGCSLSQVLVQRVDLTGAGFWGVNLVAAVPLAFFLLAGVGELVRARGWRQVSRKRAGEIFLVLGVATFALAAPLTLLLIRAEPRWQVASWLSPALSFAAATILALGLVVHRRATARDLAAVQTAGTAVLIFGGFALLLLVYFAWPEPELLCAVGLVNAVMLIGLALAARLPLLHAPAIACLALAGVMGLHLAQGRFVDRDGLGMQIVEAALMARTSLLLSVLAVASAAIGVWQRRGQRDEWLIYLASSGVLAGLAIAVAGVAGFISIEGWQQDADLAGPILLAYAVALVAIGPLTPWPFVAAAGSLLLWVGLVQVLRLNATLAGLLDSQAMRPARPILVATLAHAAITAVVAAIATGRYLVAPRDEFRRYEHTPRGELLALPLAIGAAVSAMSVLPMILWQCGANFALHGGYAAVAAVAWAAIALAQRWKWAASGMQAMLALAAALLVAGEWNRPSEPGWLLSTGHIHAQLMLLAVGAIVWSPIRRLTSNYRLSRDLLHTPWPAVDQMLLAMASLALPLWAFNASLPGIGWELGFDAASEVVAPGHPLQLVAGRGGVALALVLMALVVSLWERVSAGVLVCLGAASLAAVWIAAAFWHEQVAVATAARWAAGIYAVAWALPFIFRKPIRLLAKRTSWLRWDKLPRELAIWFCAGPLVLGGASVLVLTIVAVAQNAGGAQLRGPAVGSIFHALGPTISYAGPLLALVGVLLAYAVRQRQAGFALGGSAVFQLAVNLAFLLHVSLSSLSLPASVRSIEWLQWNAAAAGAYALVWLGLGRWIMPGGERSRLQPLGGAWALIVVQILAGCALSAALVLWASLSVFDNPAVLSPTTAQLGHWLSYVATACVLLALGWLMLPRVRGGWADIALGLAAACVAFVACSSDQYDAGRTWLAYHLLTGGWLAIGLVAAALVSAARWPKIAGQIAAHHLTAAALAALVALLAVRGATTDPGQPWWSLAATLGSLTIVTAVGLVRRSQLYAYASVLLAGLTVWLFFVAPKTGPWWRLVFDGRPPLAIVDLVGLAMVLAAGFWLACEIRAQSHRSESLFPRFRGPRVHATTLLGWLGLLGPYHAMLFLPLNWWTMLGDQIAAISFVAVVGLTLLAAAWDRRATWWLATLYYWGLIACTLTIALLAEHFELDFAPRLALWLLALAGQIALTGQLWSYGANLALFGTRLGVSDPIGGLTRLQRWLPPANLALAGAVCIGQLFLVLSLDRLELRVAAAWSPAVSAWGVLCLAQAHRRDALQVAALLMAALSAVYLGWAQLDPQEAPATWELTRAFRLLMVLSAIAFIYGLALPRWLLTTGSWNGATRTAGYLTAAAALATFVGVLALEVMLFAPGVDAPIDGVQVGAIAVVLLGLIAGLVSLAIFPGRDPLVLSETGRQVYVYAAEAVGALLFAHLYICRPTWFDTALRPYWPLIIMAIAFAGVGASELCRRLQIRVLAEPLERTGSLLPLLPALGWWIVSSQTDYSLLLLIAGLLYLVLSVTRKSWAATAAAAVAGNGALWALLGKQGFDPTSNPQFWLIPPALSVLAAAQVNKTRLPPATLAAIRYAATIVIYLSSTSEIFLRGVGNSLWPPMILAALSLAGAMLGIMLRIRAFLYLGTSFTLLALITMVWHAARAIEHVWPWWAFGIGLGIAILVLFGIFEKKRPEMLAFAARLRQWEQ